MNNPTPDAPSPNIGAGPPLSPRMVSIYELRDKLLPLMAGYPWAEDALMDLWKLGAPDPSPHSSPCILAFGPRACARQAKGSDGHVRARCGIYGCAREKRVLLPKQFEKWWADVAQRQGREFLANDILSPKQNRSRDGNRNQARAGSLNKNL